MFCNLFKILLNFLYFLGLNWFDNQDEFIFWFQIEQCVEVFMCLANAL